MMQAPPAPPSKSTGMEDSNSVSGSEPGAMGSKENKERNQSMDMFEACDCVSEFFGSFFCCLGPQKTFPLFLSPFIRFVAGDRRERA